ncbi:MAG: general secretion pathway protein GspB [Candidatus Wenzhouxiangella sp. M2_3B_020]
MSLLLDALKKSEAQRRRGAGPAIDLTSMPSRPADRRREPRRWPLFVAVVALLVLVGVAVWPWVPGLAERFLGSERPDTLARVEEPSPAIDGAGGAGASGTVETDGANARRSPAPIEQPTVVGAQRPARRAEAATTPSGSNVSPASEPAPPDAAEGPKREVRSPRREAPAAAEPRQQNGVTDRSVPQAQTPSQSQAGAGRPDVESASGSETEPEPAEDFVRPWELPQARRAEFPELDMTLHFYAEEPARRFVLINGERYGEGQRIDADVRILEIVQRGAIVDFGNYRVLIE